MNAFTKYYLEYFCLFKWLLLLTNIFKIRMTKSIRNYRSEERKEPTVSILKTYSQSFQEQKLLIHTMNVELNRLKSFRYWPCSFIHPIQLAKQGFFYFNQNDLVQCVFCKVILGQWLSTDTVEGEHKKYSPNCEIHLNKEAAMNIPLPDNKHLAYIHAISDVTGTDICGEMLLI